MRYEDYQAARDFIEKKALQLMNHEKKDYAKVGFPPQNYKVYPIYGRTFYSVMTNTCLGVIREVLMDALKKFPEKFGTGDAMDVIDAIYKTRPVFFESVERYADFLRDEQFCCVIENENGKIADKILRIDLFRKLDTNNQGNKEFTGGIFHAFKHFSINGINLSTGKDVNNILYPEKIIELAIRAFFLEQHEEVIPKKQFVSRVGLDEKYTLRFSFYYEPNTDVYFINTVFKEARR